MGEATSGITNLHGLGIEIESLGRQVYDNSERDEGDRTTNADLCELDPFGCLIDIINAASEANPTIKESDEFRDFIRAYQPCADQDFQDLVSKNAKIDNCLMGAIGYLKAILKWYKAE